MTLEDVVTRDAAPPVASPVRPFYWSVRRELWENRSLYAAPLTVAAVILFGFLISTITLPRRMRAAMALDAAKQHDLATMPFNMIAGLTMITAFLVGVFYCLDALHGERRDRSILFWKSLPVSDRTTVLAKAAIPLLVLPLLSLAIIVTTHVAMLLATTARLAGDGRTLAMVWDELSWFQMVVAMAYAFFVIALWHAPLYAWLLLISAWAKRATFLWAVLPIALVAMFERIVAQTSYFGKAIGYRIAGWFPLAFDVRPRGGAPLEPLEAMTPLRILTTPGLWLGLVVAAAFLALAVRLRRNREPI